MKRENGKSRKESVEFRGRKFTRYLDYTGTQRRLYFGADDGKKPIYLHVVIWLANNNKKRVPGNHVIHHIDFNPLNNHPKNLTCLSRSNHTNLHKKMEWQFKKPASLKCQHCNKKFISRGHRKYCSNHCWTKNRPKEIRTCQSCKNKFTALKFTPRKTCGSKECKEWLRLKTKRVREHNAP